MDRERTALDVILAAVHQKFVRMNNLCIEIMDSNLELIKTILELRKEIEKAKERSERHDNDQHDDLQGRERAHPSA